MKKGKVRSKKREESLKFKKSKKNNSDNGRQKRNKCKLIRF